MRNAKQTAARRKRRSATPGPAGRATAASPSWRPRSRQPRSAATPAAATAERVAGALAAASAKRTLDLVLGSALLALTAPALALATLVLALHPPRGLARALRRETRIGLGGHPFELRSLRTRRFRLDLLSRLPHVVRGELSLVGPAPLTPDEAALLGRAAGHWRQSVRPGLTGLAQVRARSGMPWDEPALLDAHYAEHHGTGLDLVILAQSVRIHLRGAAHGPRYPGKAHLSDTDHRLPGYSVAE
ncbi:sugar transferase [Streptomyces sp. HB132]|uniref:sugar transferase n=1 Tax=Streptomyces sp. HB132 TaxID=767388 RepID=UPI0019602C0F|nr:sugar transferase [Streptomyces sp. HB132]MBM7437738.1 lipopolysaccharide/colanic/teichoic acid biosynthesis glycosyltransferase [Streptomyces sp. HB132]